MYQSWRSGRGSSRWTARDVRRSLSVRRSAFRSGGRYFVMTKLPRCRRSLRRSARTSCRRELVVGRVLERAVGADGRAAEVGRASSRRDIERRARLLCDAHMPRIGERQSIRSTQMFIDTKCRVSPPKIRASRRGIGERLRMAATDSAAKSHSRDLDRVALTGQTRALFPSRRSLKRPSAMAMPEPAGEIRRNWLATGSPAVAIRTVGHGRDMIVWFLGA